MKHYLVSDTHFNHTKLEEWGGRSGDWQEQLMKGIEEIGVEDNLIHLGDICIGNDSEVHAELMPKSACITCTLVRGNHDNASLSKYYEWGWDLVVDGMWIDMFGERILLSHKPMHPDTHNFTMNIHGHTHGNHHRSEEWMLADGSTWYDARHHFDISPEIVGYKPVTLEWCVKQMQKRRRDLKK